MTPELDQKWWSKNKPTLSKKTGLGDALKDFQIAEDKGDYDDMLKKLSEVKKKVAGAVTLMKGKTDTVAVLKKYPKIILAEEKRIEKLKSDAEERASAASSAPAPKQKIGSDVVIWKRDFGAEIMKQTKHDWLGNIRNFTLEQKLNDDILDVFEAEGDLVTPAKIAEDSEKICRAAVKDMVTFIDKMDSAIQSGKLTDVKKAETMLMTATKTTMQATADKIERLPEAYWKKFVAQRKEYKSYKIKAGCKLGLGVFGVVAGTGGLIVGIAATAGAIPTMGGSLPLGIAGSVAGFLALCRSCTALARTISTLSKSADKTQKDLAKDLKTLRERYQNASSAQVGATEIGASTLKGILGTDAPFLASISKCNDAHDALKGKTAGLAVEQRKISKVIMDAMKEAEGIERQLKSLTDKVARKVYDKLVKARAALSKALDKCSDLGGRLSKIEDALPKLSAMMRALNDQNPKYAQIFDKVFPLVVSGILVVASAGTGFADASSVADFAVTTASLGIDIASEITDLATG